MMTLEQRVRAALGDDGRVSPWQSLMSLFRADREAFYALACGGTQASGDEHLRELADLAAKIRSAVRQTYDVVPTSDGAILESSGGIEISISNELVPQVTQFLLEVDGKASTTVPGKDYEGEAVSESEVRFRLGEIGGSGADSKEREAMLNSKPWVLRLSPEEISDLSTQPAYVTYELLHCARRAVLAPTVVYQGLKRGEGGPDKVNQGWAFCGKPRWAYRNDGTAFPVPPDLVYVVYADVDGFVFDWDWVKENPGEPGHPLDCDIRFGNPFKLDRDAVLDLPQTLAPGRFDATVACYSARGDCIFCYMTEAVSRADRINSDLTVFYDLQNNDIISGFKVKNVRRILKKDRNIVLGDAPNLTVDVDTILLESLRQHEDDEDANVEVYKVVIRALFRTTREPPNVTVADDAHMPANA